MTPETSRRSLILGLGACIIAAPAIVRASSLMKIKPMPRVISSLPGFKYEWKRTDQFHQDWEPVLYGDIEIQSYGDTALFRKLTAVIREDERAREAWADKRTEALKLFRTAT